MGAKIYMLHNMQRNFHSCLFFLCESRGNLKWPIEFCEIEGWKNQIL